MNRELIFKTPWGWMGLSASERGITEIILPSKSRLAVERRRSVSKPVAAARETDNGGTTATTALLSTARAQILEFLSGTRRSLEFPLDLSRGTAFQRRVWRTLLRVPYGRVRSYQWVADRVGGRQMARAVGGAVGANPVPLIVPCHRIVSHDGSLGGFSGGLHQKKRLLELEGTLAQLRSSSSRSRSTRHPAGRAG